MGMKGYYILEDGICITVENVLRSFLPYSTVWSFKLNTKIVIKTKAPANAIYAPTFEINRYSMPHQNKDHNLLDSFSTG